MSVRVHRWPQPSDHPIPWQVIYVKLFSFHLFFFLLTFFFFPFHMCCFLLNNNFFKLTECKFKSHYWYWYPFDTNEASLLTKPPPNLCLLRNLRQVSGCYCSILQLLTPFITYTLFFFFFLFFCPISFFSLSKTMAQVVATRSIQRTLPSSGSAHDCRAQKLLKPPTFASKVFPNKCSRVRFRSFQISARKSAAPVERVIPVSPEDDPKVRAFFFEKLCPFFFLRKHGKFEILGATQKLKMMQNASGCEFSFL